MAEKRVQELLGQMQKTLECSICLEMMTNPVSTGCGHQFCSFCLTEFLERKRQVPCPLCKKPITKRSLMKREQLGEMVEGVRNLISAFQKDTGALFSPPRGPQPSLLPGTPDSIQAKSSTGKKQGKTSAQGNVRRTKRKQPADLESAVSKLLVESSDSVPVTNLCGKNQETGGKDTELSKKGNSEHLELLRCIEEGTLNADASVEDNHAVTETEGRTFKAKSKDTCKTNIERHTRSGKCVRQLKTNKCDKKLERNLTECTKENIDIERPKQVTVSNNQVIKEATVRIESVENTDKIETNESSFNCNSADTAVSEKVETDAVEPVLSGVSVTMESETSSGPLFKTPVDPRSLNHSKNENDFSDRLKDIRKKSLRSMDKKGSGSQGEVDNEDEKSVTLTPEVLVVKDKTVSRTYCRKDKDLFNKEKKATRKVAEWLKNIPSLANNENEAVNKSEIIGLKERNQQRKLSRKNLKVMQEEEAMGSKIKHLAKQIQDKELLFDFDDFGGKYDKNSLTNSALRKDMDDTGKSLENDVEIGRENELDSGTGDESNIGNFTNENDTITGTYADKNCNKANQNIDEEQIDVKTYVEKNTGKEPVRKKRIFKSRTVQPSTESSTDKVTVKENSKNISVQKTIPKENNKVLVGEVIQIESQESELQSSDPYEFKSSQNTPKKVGKKKGSQKKGKLTAKAKGKQKSKGSNIDVVQVQNNRRADMKFEKMWDKNLVPNKTILKTKNKEIEKIAASLQLAEDYDLLTCTQEAAESIAKEKMNSESVALDGINSEIMEISTKSDVVLKKVRFTEPVISDFIQTGKIDIIGYRKAREEFNVTNNEVKNKKNSKEESKSGGKCSEKMHVSLKDGENPLRQRNNVDQDAESDDLSEDYRFQDDSSGTDDLDIEPTQEEFEKPNIDIQPEEIKAKLSQELLVQETPLIPVNKDSPNLHIIEETPAIFSVPKFNKTLSKPVGKFRKPLKNKTPPLKCNVDGVPETPNVFMDEQLENSEAVELEVPDKGPQIAADEENKHKLRNKSKVKDVADVVQSINCEKKKSDVEEEVSKLSVESDETKSPEIELELRQNTDKSKGEEPEQMQVDTELETLAQEDVCREASLSQNSESLLQPNTLAAKDLYTSSSTTDVNEHKSNINADTDTLNQEKLDLKNDKSSLTSERGSLNKTKPKKKRKSFMLEEPEESLDFGSLTECVVESANDDNSESANKAKRQRLNRLRRSPKTKEKGNKKSEDDTHNNEEVEKDIGKDNKPELSGSVEIIPDTMVQGTEHDEIVDSLASFEGNKTGKNHADTEGTNEKKLADGDRETENFRNNLVDKSQSYEVIDLSSDSMSVSSLEEREKTKKKSNRRLVVKNKKGNKQESQTRNFDNSSDQVDVIAETELTNTQDIIASEKKEELENKKIKENCIMTTSRFKNPNCFRSPNDKKKCLNMLKDEKKMKSEQSENICDSQSDIVRVRHLSGMLASPHDSLVLSGMKGSPEDIFHMDSEMPSVDLSPDAGANGLVGNSPSLDLGTLGAPDTLQNDENSQKISQSQSELNLHEMEENLKNISDAKVMKEKANSDSLNFTPEKDTDVELKGKNDLKLNQDSDSSPEEKRRRSNVKAVRGFSKKKRLSDMGQSQMSGSSSGSSVISRTPQAVTSVKYKSPVVKFLSGKAANKDQNDIVGKTEQNNQDVRNCDLSKNIESPLTKSKQHQVGNVGAKDGQTNTPVKTLKEVNVAKYSPLSVKREKGKENKETAFEAEVVELKHYDDDDDDECLLSPNDLPDLDDENVTVTSVGENVEQIENPKEICNDQVRDKMSKRSKVSPKLSMNSREKENNIVFGEINKSKSDQIESVNKITIPETMCVDDDDDDNDADEEYEYVKCDKRLKESKKTEHENVNIESEAEKANLAGEDENSVNSSSSSEFRLDSSDDEESPEKQALTEISKFDKIVEYSIDLEKSKDLHTVDSGLNKNSKMSDKKIEKKKRKDTDIEKESLDKKMGKHRQTKVKEDENSIQGEAPVNLENMYSTRLDSSPASCAEEINVNVESEPVILESDLDGDESDNDDEESDEAVVRRKGVKRAILSDSSSDDDDDGSKHMDVTSSSAFSSQSENLTTQERCSLEKEVERMAREMEAMKEQLRRSKELNQAKRTESKRSPKPVTVDDSNEEMIEVNDSDNDVDDDDMFMSPPAITPGDLELDDEETIDPAVVQDMENDVAVTGETEEQIDESVDQTPGSLTVPESDPSQLSRPVLADLDPNIPHPATTASKRQVGIVVTGLNLQQIKQTKKLAALTDAKFFTKFNDLVTHVIVNPADEDETICDRTLKFFQGIARKCWIVNFFWVVDSRQVGHLLPEGPYEIQGDTANNEAHYGPKKSRLSGDKKLFQKFQFSLVGDNTFLSKDSMADLIETCGGDVSSVTNLGQGRRIPLVISCADLDDDEEDAQSVVKHAREIYKGLGVVTVTREWILDSLTLYKIQPLQDYVVTDVPNMTLPQI